MADSHVFEFPDPIVSAFLTRVRALSMNERASVEMHPRNMLSGALLRDIPAVLFGVAKLYVIMAISIRTSTSGCPDPEAQKEYERFWRELASRGWSPLGRARVAWTLQAIRLRAQPATHRMYSRGLARIVSPTSIGWPEGEAAVGDAM